MQFIKTNRKALVVGMFLLLILISCLALIFYDNTTKLELVYGEKLPSFQVTSIDEGVVDFENNKKYNVMFYLSKTCESCIRNLSNYKEIVDHNNNEDLGYSLIWQNGVPKDLIEFKNIPSEINYDLSGNYFFADVTPFYFIINENSEIIFTSMDIDSLKNKLKTLVN